MSRPNEFIDSLRARIESVSPLTDQKEVRELRSQIWNLNFEIPENKQLFELARRKGVV